MTKRRGFTHVRVGLAGAHHALHKRTSCSTGGFYTNPTTGMTIKSANPINITWDTSCLTDTSAVDIYLIAPTLANSRIHEWQDVNYALGSYQTTLDPKWWNASSSIPLQFSIVTSGTQPFLSPFPAGPVFTVTSTSSSGSGSNSNGGNTVTHVNNFPTNKSLSRGKIAAGLLIPLFLIALGVYFYIKKSRAKGKEKRKRFSEAVDKRMSTISSDWKSITAAGATAAIRNSIAVGSTGNRSSAFTFGAIRPTSTMAVEGDSASIGKLSLDAPQMAQLRPGIRASAFGERVSRVSFATDVRPSMESRRTTTTSRAFRSSRASSVVPPLPIPAYPVRNDTGDMSPTQTLGALDLTLEDIRARLEGDNAESHADMEDILPSLSLVSTGHEQDAVDDYLSPEKHSIDLPIPPFPAHPAPLPTSPTSGMLPMHENVMSPDEMLRAYATRKIVSPPTSPIAFPARTLRYSGTTMRTLYSPRSPTPTSSTPTSSTPTSSTPTSSTPDPSSNSATRISASPTLDSEKRFTTSYASIDPYGGFVG